MSVFQKYVPNCPEKLHLHFWRFLRAPSVARTLFLPFQYTSMYFCYFLKTFQWKTKFFCQFSEYSKRFSDFPEVSENFWNFPNFSKKVPHFSYFCFNFKIKCQFFKKMYQIFRKKSIYILGVPSAPPYLPYPFYCLFHTLQCTSVIFLKLLSGKQHFFCQFSEYPKIFPGFLEFSKNSKNFPQFFEFSKKNLLHRCCFLTTLRLITSCVFFCGLPCRPNPNSLSVIFK